MFDPYRVREDFPIFRNRSNLVYLDNAATTHKPYYVINAVREFYERYSANIHRGVYGLTYEATKLYEEAHAKVAKFINASSWDEIIFVRNATEAPNIVAYSLALWDLSEGDEVIVTIMEHHSNLLPWRVVSKIKGLRLRVIGLKSNYMLDYEALESAVSSRTRVTALTHVSNVLGTINDVRRVARLAHSVGAYVVVDGSQSVPHMPIDVKSLDEDFLVFSDHKMLGPTGIGVLYAKSDILENFKPLLYGGDMIKSVHILDGEIVVELNDKPWRYEAGTPNIAGAIGLATAIDYLRGLGMENVRAHEIELMEYLLQKLSELEPYVEVYGPRNARWRGGIVSFNVKGHNPHVIATMLSTYEIAVRSGFHCAQPLHEYLGLRGGSIRVSTYIYNTKEDIDKFIDALKSIVRELLQSEI